MRADLVSAHRELREIPPQTETSPQKPLGWLNEATFVRASATSSHARAMEQLRVVIFNLAPGVPFLKTQRLALLKMLLNQVMGRAPSVLLLPAGFFGFRFLADERWHWEWTEDCTPEELRAELHALIVNMPSSFALAVGVDVTGNDQRQWWFAADIGFKCEVRRSGSGRHATALADRIVPHAGFTLLGFVCGEVYEWHEDEFINALAAHHVDVVLVSAHQKVNRVHAPVVSSQYKRWAFQRRLQAISPYCGAALAQARGFDDRFVRNCDNWFVHRGSAPFPGPRVGQPFFGGSDTAHDNAR